MTSASQPIARPIGVHRAQRRGTILAIALLLVWAAGPSCVTFELQQERWNDDAFGPLVPHDTFPGDCSICHLPDRWDVLKPDFTFDHEAQTSFALEGAHGRAQCLRCHNDRGPVTFFLARGCAGCHLDPHQGSFGLGCDTCHVQDTWQPGGLVEAHADTSFDLLGAHVAVSCVMCHPNSSTGEFRGAPTECHLCHQRDLAGAVPDHASNGWTNDCERCHNPTRWSRAQFDHAFFPLTLGHATVACASCHQGGAFTAVSSDCVDCHRDDAARAVPDHGGFSTNCIDCHTTAGWGGAGFDHDFFPLTFSHAGLGCTQCHTSGVFGSIPSDCVSCHRNDYVTASPDHQASGFSTECELCHSTVSFSGAVFDHGFFPLQGGHDGVTCQQCHGARPGPIPSDCVSCHQADAQRAQPDHSGFSTDCTQCHTTTTFRGAIFNHDFFPLEAGHGGLDCARCHGPGTPGPIANDCISCHRTDYQTARPDHSGFSTDCTQCHTTTSFRGAAFNHDFFPLEAGHGGLDCARCHGPGTPGPIPSDCMSCHRSDFQGAPEHTAAGLPQDCTQCHTTSAWGNVSFNHTPLFPLTGDHRRTCSTCHQGSTSTFRCVGSGCHTQNNTNGDHRNVNGYRFESSACLSCHPNGD